MVYCLVRYFLVRIRIAECLTNSGKRFRCETVFENEHTFYSWIDAPARHLHNWREQRPSNKGNLDSSVTEEVGRVLHRSGPTSDLIVYRSTWLLMGCVLNGTPCNRILSFKELRLMQMSVITGFLSRMSMFFGSLLVVLWRFFWDDSSEIHSLDYIYSILVPNVGNVIALLLHIREGPGLNLGAEAICRDWGFSWFYSVPPDKFQGGTSN
jgi:hypothetical protein